MPATREAMGSGAWTGDLKRSGHQSALTLESGARIGIVGGGPAGCFFGYFALEFAQRLGLDIQADVYEPRDFSRPGPGGCNMCGGIISESLVQLLAAEGILLPDGVVQRGIDAYVLHTSEGQVRIDTPMQERRIAGVHRGGGPRDLKHVRWESFDGYLQRLAAEKGLHWIPERVDGISWSDGFPVLKTRHIEPRTYDLVVVAAGVNSTALKLFQGTVPGYQPPRTVTAAIREFHLGEDVIDEHLGSAFHVFLLDLPGLEFAAIIPKGDYASVCMIGDSVDRGMLDRFLQCPEVRRCMPPGWKAEELSCRCSPHMNVAPAPHPFADRIVFIGDAGVTRLYKDGIGAAYRTAKAAARTAIFDGVGSGDFEKHYAPTCRSIEGDNVLGRFVFRVTRGIQKRSFARSAVLRMVDRERRKPPSQRRMSSALWDVFTGSAPYRDILMRTLHPSFIARFAWDGAACALKSGPPRVDPAGRP